MAEVIFCLWQRTKQFYLQFIIKDKQSINESMKVKLETNIGKSPLAPKDSKSLTAEISND